MSEFWKSNPRKFCDFCKCWLADNKISISIHENGKTHQENVRKKISLSQKSSAKKAKDERKAETMFQLMERNAEIAHKKDCCVSNLSGETEQRLSGLGKIISEQNPKKRKYAVNNETITLKEESPEWYEFKSNSGRPYFVNVKTNKSSWTKPESVKILKLHDNVKPIENHTEPSIAMFGTGPFDEFNRDVNTSNSENFNGKNLTFGSSSSLVVNGEGYKPIDLGLPDQEDNSHLFSHLPLEVFEENDNDETLVISEKRAVVGESSMDKEGENMKQENGSFFKKRKLGNSKTRNIKLRDL